MRLTEKGGLRKVAIYRLYETTKETEEKYQEKHNECERYNKLADLEDIEDERGVDLVTLFEALKNGIWIKKTIIEKGEIKNLLFFYEDISLYKDCLYACPVDIYDERVSIHQYGKTWALTKEELENETIVHL